MENQAKAPPEVKNLISFLRNKSGMKIKTGVLNGNRVDYFKGSAAVNALLSPAYAKTRNVPKVTSEEQAVAVLQSVLAFAFYLRVDRGGPTGGKGSPKMVSVNQMQMFKPEMYYAWFYEGSQLGLKLGGLAMVAVMLAGVMFPLWPPIMRLGVWYLSIGVLCLIGLFFVIAIVRLIFYVITLVVARPGIWIFPNLFEDVGFFASFVPLWAWDVPPPKKGKKKAGGKSKSKRGAGGEEGQKSRGGSKAGMPSVIPGAGPAEANMGRAPPEAGGDAAPTQADSKGNGEAEGGDGSQQATMEEEAPSLDDLN